MFEDLIKELILSAGVAGIVLAICMKYILMKDERIKQLTDSLTEAQNKRTEDMRDTAMRLLALSDSRAKSSAEVTSAVSQLSDSLTKLEDRFDGATGKHATISVRDSTPTRKHRRLNPALETETEAAEWTGKD